MAGSVNKVIILGNVGKDPEIRSMQSGSRMCNLSVATSESWRDKHSGERKEKTEWHRVTIWPDTLVDIIEKYVRKGDKIYIEGQIETRKWTDQSGVERFSTEIAVKGFSGTVNLLGDRRGDGGRARSSGRMDEEEPAAAPRGGRRDDLDDEIPF